MAKHCDMNLQQMETELDAFQAASETAICHFPVVKTAKGALEKMLLQDFNRIITKSISDVDVTIKLFSCIVMEIFPSVDEIVALPLGLGGDESGGMFRSPSPGSGSRRSKQQ